jgi:hypothetical protein
VPSAAARVKPNRQPQTRTTTADVVDGVLDRERIAVAGMTSLEAPLKGSFSELWL